MKNDRSGIERVERGPGALGALLSGQWSTPSIAAASGRGGTEQRTAEVGPQSSLSAKYPSAKAATGGRASYAEHLRAQMNAGDMSRSGKYQYIMQGGQNKHNHYYSFNDHFRKDLEQVTQSQRYQKDNRNDQLNEATANSILQSLSVRASIEDHGRLRGKDGGRLDSLLGGRFVDSKDQESKLMTCKEHARSSLKQGPTVKGNAPGPRSRIQRPSLTQGTGALPGEPTSEVKLKNSIQNGAMISGNNSKRHGQRASKGLSNVFDELEGERNKRKPRNSGRYRSQLPTIAPSPASPVNGSVRGSRERLEPRVKEKILFGAKLPDRESRASPLGGAKIYKGSFGIKGSGARIAGSRFALPKIHRSGDAHQSGSDRPIESGEMERTAYLNHDLALLARPLQKLDTSVVLSPATTAEASRVPAGNSSIGATGMRIQAYESSNFRFGVNSQSRS